MKLLPIASFRTEAEALMHKDILKQQGIFAEVKADPATGALRNYYGGASMPIERWELSVPETLAEAARLVLPEQEPPKAMGAKKGLKIFVWGAIIYSIASVLFLYFIVKYFADS